MAGRVGLLLVIITWMMQLWVVVIALTVAILRRGMRRGKSVQPYYTPVPTVEDAGKKKVR